MLISATTFDQEALNVVDESTLSPAEAYEYADTANCGMVYNLHVEMDVNRQIYTPNSYGVV